MLVDELAHTNPEGRKRYEVVEELLDAGIDVMTTVNVANLVSVRDIAVLITGAGALEGVPDEVVRAGDVILVDLPPEHCDSESRPGLVYSTDRVGGALANYFRPSNLGVFSASLHGARLDGSVDETFAFLDREAAGLTEGHRRRVEPRRGESGDRARVRARGRERRRARRGARRSPGRARAQPGTPRSVPRNTGESVGARYREVRGTNPADTLGDIALRESANRVVVGNRRSRLGSLVRGSVASRIRRRVPDLQVDEVRAVTSDGAGRRGSLRVNLGAAPGVGKTYAMLEEGRRARDRGRDVVVGFVETYGRPRTEEAIDGLEVIPRR